MISVCMPYYMRQSDLDRSLLSIRKHYANMDYEIVICDDGSPVPVLAPDCTVVSLPVKHHAMNPCVPINRAVDASRGEIIVLTNPEIEHRTPVLQAMLERFDGSNYVISACRDAYGDWLCKSTIKGGTDGRGAMPAGSGFHFCTMLSRKTFYLAGGFNEAYREGQAFDDNDWLYRLQSIGTPFVLCDDLVVWHHKVACKWPDGGHARNRQLFESLWGQPSHV